MREGIIDGEWVEINGTRMQLSTESVQTLDALEMHLRRNPRYPGFFYDDGDSREWVNANRRVLYGGPGAEPLVVPPVTDLLYDETLDRLDDARKAGDHLVLYLAEDGSTGYGLASS